MQHEQPQSMMLGVNEVHVWRTSLTFSSEELAEFECILSPDEQTRARRYYLPRDKDRFVAGRAILRMILAQYLSLRPQDIQFSFGPNGKPMLYPADPSRLEFNLSHSGDRALVAVALGFSIGIDIEKIRPDVATAQLAVHICSEAEQAALAALPEGQRVAAFFKCWTSKEACIKASGRGLSLSLRDFEVSVDPTEPVKLLRPCRHGEELWSLHELTPETGYAAALAVGRTPVHIIPLDWPRSASGDASVATPEKCIGGSA
jgi:4'-phosphopantetheinyl transferase